MRRLIHCLTLATVAALFAMTLGTAHADVSVSIATEDGSTVYSLPALPSDVGGYPEELPTVITGTASFDNADGTVLISFQDAPEAPAVITRQATCNLDETNTTCTWSLVVPFVMHPGTYIVTASASEPSDPEPIGASDSVTLQIL